MNNGQQPGENWSVPLFHQCTFFWVNRPQKFVMEHTLNVIINDGPIGEWHWSSATPYPSNNITTKLGLHPPLCLDIFNSTTLLQASLSLRSHDGPFDFQLRWHLQCFVTPSGKHASALALYVIFEAEAVSLGFGPRQLHFPPPSLLGHVRFRVRDFNALRPYRA